MSFIPRTAWLRLGPTRASVHVAADGTMTVAPRDGDAAEPTSVTVHYLGHGRVRIDDGGGQVMAYAVDEGTRRWVFLDGETFLVDVESGPAARRRAAGGPESLSAPMPATVVKVVATPGARVTRGQTLLVLEAMKMELPLKAPHDAIVTEVRCAEGELVEAGVALVALEGVAEADPADGQGEGPRS